MKVYKTLICSRRERCEILEELDILYQEHRGYFVFYTKKDRERAIVAMAFAEGGMNPRLWVLKVVATELFLFPDGDDIMQLCDFSMDGNSIVGGVHLLGVGLLLGYGKRCLPDMPIWTLGVASFLDVWCIAGIIFLLGWITARFSEDEVSSALSYCIPWIGKLVLRGSAFECSAAFALITIKHAVVTALVCIALAFILAFCAGVVEVIEFSCTSPKTGK